MKIVEMSSEKSQSCSVSRETTDICNSYQRDTLVRQSMITVALFHKFVYEFRGNNTYIILDRTALHIGKYLTQSVTTKIKNKSLPETSFDIMWQRNFW